MTGYYRTFWSDPEKVAQVFIEVDEVCRWLYLPIFMRDQDEYCRYGPLVQTEAFKFRLLVDEARADVQSIRPNWDYRYIYLTAKRGWVNAGSPQNRAGWHCDGFGTNDLNYVWSDTVCTEMVVGVLPGRVPKDHLESMRFFDRAAPNAHLRLRRAYPNTLYRFGPRAIHRAVPPEVGCMRTFVKVSFSDHEYNLLGNNHNPAFSYRWKMHERDLNRNDPHRAQKDYHEP